MLDLSYIRENSLNTGKTFLLTPELEKVLGQPRFAIHGSVLGYSWLNLGRYLADQCVKLASPATTAESGAATVASPVQQL